MKTVVIVDDNLGCMQGLSRLLEGRGISVIAFECPLAARDWLNSEPFDLLISDIQMPGLNGFQLVRHLRELKPRIPAILVSSATADDTQELAATAGAAVFVDKSHGPVAVWRHVQRLLGAA